MSNESTPYPASFQAAVALAALRGEHSVAELAARYSLPEALIAGWTAT